MAIDTSCSTCSKSKMEITARAYDRALSLIPHLDSTEAPLSLLSLTRCTPPTPHQAESDLGGLLLRSSTAINLSSVTPRMTPSAGPEQYSKGPIAALHHLFKIFKARGLPKFSVALDVRHPDIFEFIAASTLFESITFIVLVPNNFRELVQNDGEIVLSESDTPTHHSNQNERWQMAIRAKVESPDLVPCLTGPEEQSKIYSLGAQSMVGVIREEKIYLKARRIVEALSYASRQMGNARIAWREEN